MKRAMLVPAGMVLGLCVSASSGAVQGVTWKAELVAAQEIPKPAVSNTHGQGTFLGTFTGTKLKYKLTFSGLSGPANAAHIHLGAMGKAGNVVVPLCGPCKSPVTGVVAVSKALRNDFANHLLYVNVHTAKNPNGEIRGQLEPSVP
jgi:CHRD domain